MAVTWSCYLEPPRWSPQRTIDTLQILHQFDGQETVLTAKWVLGAQLEAICRLCET